MLSITGLCEGFRTPAPSPTSPQALGPASENLQRTKPRVGTKDWFGESSYGDFAAISGGNAMAGGFTGFDFATRLAREMERKRALLL